jgi:hypothetical protein
MATMASRYASTFEIRDVFLVGKVEINNEHNKKIKINNLKTTRDLGVYQNRNLKQKLNRFWTYIRSFLANHVHLDKGFGPQPLNM